MPNEIDPEIPIPEQEDPDPLVLLEEARKVPDLSLELEDHQIKSQRIDLAKKQHELDVEKAMLPERKGYAKCIFGVSVAWLIFIGACVWKAGSHVLILSDSVLIALITTTTVNVLGLFYIVARWLFPQKNDVKLPDKEG